MGGGGYENKYQSIAVKMCFLNNKILYFKLVTHKGMKEVTLQKKNTEPALVRDCCMSMKVSINLI